MSAISMNLKMIKVSAITFFFLLFGMTKHLYVILSNLIILCSV